MDKKKKDVTKDISDEEVLSCSLDDLLGDKNSDQVRDHLSKCSRSEKFMDKKKKK
jgi:hypothetical protein